MTIKDSSPQRTQRTLLRNCLPALLAACFGAAQAAPETPEVVAGQATFLQQGNVFTITNTPNTIINWQRFSVGAGEITRFVQESSKSAVLNRIVGQDPTQILGALQSNGRVFLINPNGIMFGRDARIDVGALTASTLNLSNQDFLAGKNNFTQNGPAGALKNQGAITTPSGGQVFLIAPNVDNSGIITSPEGQVVLAAGHTVQLVDSSNPDLHVVLSAPSDQAINLGQVIAQGGKVGIYGALVNQRGIVNANSARIGENGKIVFKASGDTRLEAGSVTSATGAGSGGEISVQGQRVALTGDARLDASGAQGGGSVLVGGGYQGKNPLIAHARQTVMGKDVSIKADATASGNGGKVVLWSDGSTRAFGGVSAKGGSGGLVETSGYMLDVNGIRVDAGNGGTWLLDPYNLTIDNSGSVTPLSSVDQFADLPTDPMAGEAYINVAMINSAAPATNIMLQAINDIHVNAAITRSGGSGSLTMQAGNNINVNAAINTAGGALTLFADHAPYTDLVGNVNINAALSTGNGELQVHGNYVQTANSITINSGTGNMNFGVNNNFTLAAGALLRGDGNINLTAASMNLGGNIMPASGTGAIVTIAPTNSAAAIEIMGAPTASPNLQISPLRLNPIKARQLILGNAAHTGTISIMAPYGGMATPAETPNLTLLTSGAIAISAPIDLQLAGSNLVLERASAGFPAIVTTAAGTLRADNIVLTSDAMNLAGTITATAVNGGSVTLSPQSTGAAIRLGFNAADETGALGLTDTELGLITASKLSIAARPGSTNSLMVTGALNLSASMPGTSSLSLDAAGGSVMLQAPLTTGGELRIKGAAIENFGNSIATAGSVRLKGTGVIGGDAPFYTATSLLAADNFKAGGLPAINLHNTGTLSLGTISQSGSGNLGGIKVANLGGMTLVPTDAGNAPGPTMVAVLTQGGPIELSTLSPLTIDAPITSNGGAITLLAGNSGTLTIGPAGILNSGAGNINITGGPVINNGSVTSTTGNITVVGSPVSGTGTYATSGVLTGAPAAPPVTGGPTQPPPTSAPPTVNSCQAQPSAPGCAELIEATINRCIIDPTGSACSTVLPHLNTCIASPATLGCSVVLPALSLCATAPGTPGCSVVLPSLSQCLANPGALGCAAVLPTLSQCVGTPGLAGCSVVLPPLSRCVVDPSLAGCSAVLPPLSQCVSDPTVAGCSAVLPPLTQCVADPTVAGCLAVLPTLSDCVRSPATTGCSVVLPSLTQCVTNPNQSGCAQVLPSLATCVARPDSAGCVAVLPTLSACVVTPSRAGCTAVLPTLSACVANPPQTGCSAVLPSLAVCSERPGTAGCSVVLPSIAQCVTNPTQAGCAAVLPTLAQCISASSTAGCGVVLPTLARCVANPAQPGCVVVLPSLSQCIANPPATGCSVVLPSLARCAVNAAEPGCSVVLPTLNQCVTNPGLTGCGMVLPSLPTCVANRGSPGCSVVLPSLSQCSATPGLIGCSVVLPSLGQCVASPGVAGCAVVLPSLAQCAATPSLAGCAVVLPLLSQCVATPNATGCSAVLPTLRECTGSPTLQGCSVVLPPVSACVANPAAEGCVVVAPPPQNMAGGEVAQVISETVNIINTVGTSPAAGGSATPKGDSVKDENLSLTTIKGDASELRKKTYCN